jgi:acetyltransferase EpsM
MKPKLVIWGAGGHARVAADIVRLADEYELVGFLDDVHPERAGEFFCGAPVLGGREQLGRLRAEGVTHALLAFGDGAARLRLAEALGRHGLRAAAAVHPRAVVARDVAVGPGTVIVAGAVVNPGARLGAQVIVNTCASVDHDCVVEDGAHVAPGARLAGGVWVGQGAWVGLGAVVKERVRVGSRSVVGAGAVVLRDLPDGVVACGVPARVLRAA